MWIKRLCQTPDRCLVTGAEWGPPTAVALVAIPPPMTPSPATSHLAKEIAVPLMCLGGKIHAGLRPVHVRTSLLGARSPLHQGEAGVATVPDTRVRTAGPASRRRTRGHRSRLARASPRARDLRLRPPPPSSLPDPRCPTRPRPGHRAAAALLGLRPAPWRRAPRSPRPAPARPGPHSRHAPSSGSPSRCEEELGVLGALATLLLSGLWSPPPGDRRLNSLLPLGSASFSCEGSAT